VVQSRFYYCVSKSVSRVLYLTIIYLGSLSPARSCDLPTGQRRAAAFCALFGLAPGGVYMARLLPVCRWALTSPFQPCRIISGGMFLLHFPWSRLHRTLSGTLPCGARTFLMQCMRLS